MNSARRMQIEDNVSELCESSEEYQGSNEQKLSAFCELVNATDEANERLKNPHANHTNALEIYLWRASRATLSMLPENE